MNKIDREKLYTLDESVDLVKSTQRAKFTETFDVSVKLGIDANKPDQHVKGFVDLPHGTGIKKKVLAIVSDKDIESAKEADYAGDKYIEEISKGWMDFDIVVAAPDVMAKIGKIGKILGTKGLMPNVKYGTISKDIASTIRKFKEGRIILKNDKYGLINAPLGKSSFESAKLKENAKFFFNELLKLKPSTSKGQYLRSVSMSLTMGPSAKVDISSLQKEIRG